MIARIVAYMIGGSVAVLAIGELFQGGIITYDAVSTVLVFGLVLGLLNGFLMPVLKAITLPLNCLTFGLFALVLNAGVFALATYLVPGVEADIWGIGVGAVLSTVISGVLFAILDEK
ncbi:MAG: phage holin family protein [Thermomicrobiales bacterium]|jgi:putative membrane protein|nr:phage holin family protein [Thermomicrobiales bacterium]MCC6944018.1 phage holin family protein [Thermomicrobiales bacterium]